MALQVVLQSWKEISKYVGRTERTVQRWEQDFGFPVHRPSGKSRSAVMALTKEIQEWTRGRPSLLQIRRAPRLQRTILTVEILGHKSTGPEVHNPNLASGEEIWAAGIESRRLQLSLLQEQKVLRESMATSRQEQKMLLSKLRRNLNAAVPR